MKLALALNFSDLEDAMQCITAACFLAEVIVTRNLRDYKKSPIKAMSPAEVLPFLY
ncbi:MAG: hypothetical protein ACH346_04615 [Chthoniobacterales bacterium]